MGVTELESVTSCMSSKRSNQLSYTPVESPSTIRFRPSTKPKIPPSRRHDNDSSGQPCMIAVGTFGDRGRMFCDLFGRIWPPGPRSLRSLTDGS